MNQTKRRCVKTGSDQRPPRVVCHKGSSGDTVVAACRRHCSPTAHRLERSTNTRTHTVMALQAHRLNGAVIRCPEQDDNNRHVADHGFRASFFARVTLSVGSSTNGLRRKHGCARPSRVDALPSSILSISMLSHARSATVTPEMGLSQGLADGAVQTPHRL